MSTTDAARTETLDSFRWSVRLYDGEPWKRWIVLLAAVVAGAVGIAAFHSLLFGLLGFVMILGSTMEYWLGASYAIDDRGVKSRVGASVTGMEWANVKRVELGERNGRVSPLEKDGRTAPFRGVTLRYSADDRDRVAAEIRRRWEGDVRLLEG